MNYNISLSGGQGFYQSVNQVTAGALQSASEVIPDGSADLDVSFAFPNAVASDSAVAMGLLADVSMTVDVCLADNTVLQSIPLTANEPYVWADGVTDPTWRNGGDVAKLRITNASGTNGTLSADVLYDPTP